MPDLEISVLLPYYLRLSEGDYETAEEGEVVRVAAPQGATPFDAAIPFDSALPFDGMPPRTPVSALFSPEESADPDEIQKRRSRCCEQLLRRINRLLRWYRAVSKRAEISEVTRAQVSPFRFEAIGATPPAEWTAPLEFEPAVPQPAALTLEQTTQAVRDGLAGGNDPDVADLFLLDAERALHQGRFRKSVLFCWSTIDSVFNRRYEGLVDAALAGEPGEARKLFKDLDFGLRNKMSVGMGFVANRSLFTEPAGFWEKMTSSYVKRNKIIHEGQNATEDEAIQAIEVARRIVQIMTEV